VSGASRRSGARIVLELPVEVQGAAGRTQDDKDEQSSEVRSEGQRPRRPAWYERSLVRIDAPLVGR
jgi:hypothetical protein